MTGDVLESTAPIASPVRPTTAPLSSRRRIGTRPGVRGAIYWMGTRCFLFIALVCFISMWRNVIFTHGSTGYVLMFERGCLQYDLSGDGIGFARTPALQFRPPVRGLRGLEWWLKFSSLPWEYFLPGQAGRVAINPGFGFVPPAAINAPPPPVPPAPPTPGATSLLTIKNIPSWVKQVPSCGRVPLWIVALLLLLPTTVVTGVDWLQRHRYCWICRYSLVGNVSGTCPECGTTIPGGVPPVAEPARIHRCRGIAWLLPSIAAVLLLCLTTRWLDIPELLGLQADGSDPRPQQQSCTSNIKFLPQSNGPGNITSMDDGLPYSLSSTIDISSIGTSWIQSAVDFVPPQSDLRYWDRKGKWMPADIVESE